MPAPAIGPGRDRFRKRPAEEKTGAEKRPAQKKTSFYTERAASRCHRAVVGPAWFML